MIVCIRLNCFVVIVVVSSAAAANFAEEQVYRVGAGNTRPETTNSIILFPPRKKH
jgi:hypothetical protein